MFIWIGQRSYLRKQTAGGIGNNKVYWEWGRTYHLVLTDYSCFHPAPICLFLGLHLSFVGNVVVVGRFWRERHERDQVATWRCILSVNQKMWLKQDEFSVRVLVSFAFILWNCVLLISCFENNCFRKMFVPRMGRGPSVYPFLSPGSPFKILRLVFKRLEGCQYLPT